MRLLSQTIPVSFVRGADEMEVVDAPAELSLGTTDGTTARDASTFGRQQLSELREIALLLAADVVDRQLDEYLNRRGIKLPWGLQERILICMRPQLNAQKMIESGRRNADRFHGEFLVCLPYRSGSFARGQAHT
jgi:two-component system sensor histidine kinase KdpD